MGQLLRIATQAQGASGRDDNGHSVPFDTMPGIVRRLGRVAAEIGASEFALFMIPSAGELRRLVPCVDSSYPGISDTTKLLHTGLGDGFAKAAAATAVPFSWTAGPLAHEPELAWTRPVPAPLPDRSGIAFPVSAEHGQPGVIVFTGERLNASMQALADVHARCFGLFAQAARLRPVMGSQLPKISQRERECLHLAADGHTSEEIAAKLGLSVHTANQYLGNTTEKLNAVNRMHAVAKALRAGLIE